jgi:tRNA U34 5-carboxymethylaminomethyl modifying GTPase MnmE/TrmE
MRHSVDYLYSLYDALVSINVPTDKARAVVDAMERDMGTTLATKVDLEALRAAMKTDLQALGASTKASLENLRVAMKADLQALGASTKADLENLRTATQADYQALTATTRTELQLMRQEMSYLATKGELGELHKEVALIRKDMDIVSERLGMVTTNVTVRLGAIMAGLTGLLFAGLKLA